MRKVVMFNIIRAAMIISLAIFAGPARIQPLMAHVHADPDGNSVTWYPRACCGNGDCKPVTEIQRVGAGLWLTAADGTTVFVGLGQPRLSSRDMRWHICVGYDYDAQSPMLHCVFEPPATASAPPSQVH